MFRSMFYAVLVLSQVLYITAEFTKDDCGKDVEGEVTCRGKFEAYKWDVASHQCILARYGGCFPTKNNFRTKEQCESIARPICQDVQFTKEDCSKDVEGELPCRGSFPVYKWDDNKQECIPAIYGGCIATPNNFATKEECEKIAKPVCVVDEPWIWH